MSRREEAASARQILLSRGPPRSECNRRRRSRCISAGRMMSTATHDVPTVAGIRLSHPDRLIYPDLGISKLDLARYYENIERWIVPHVKGRPLTLVHCPAGIAGKCMYLKHAKAWGPN